MLLPPDSASRRKLLKELTDLDYDKAETNFAHFVKCCWAIIEPDTPLLWNWHHDLVCEYMTAMRDGQITRLLINMPPRYMKSIIASVCFPAWVWATHPQERFMYGSFSYSLSVKHSIDCRTIIDSPWYQARWGNKFHLSDDQNVKTEYTNNKRGHRIATSMDGSAIGKGGNYIGIDDPHDTIDVHSDLIRQATCDSFRQKFTTRLDDKRTGKIFVVMQRLHEADVSGLILSGELGKYEHLVIPGVAEKKCTVVFPVSKKEQIREIGDILHPAREGPDEIQQARKSLGPYGFSGQYQQSPTPAGGAIIKIEWTKKRYKELPGRIDEWLISNDAAFKETDQSAYVVTQCWARLFEDYYLVHQLRRRTDIVGTIEDLVTMARRYPRATWKLIEDKANGPAIMQLLKGKVPGLIEVQPTGTKEARCHAVAPLWAAGNVWLPEDTDIDPETQRPWLDGFIKEVTTFPKSAYKDQVDTMTQALNHFVASSHSRFTENMVASKVTAITGLHGRRPEW